MYDLKAGFYAASRSLRAPSRALWFLLLAALAGVILVSWLSFNKVIAWRFDFDIFYLGGLAVLHGRSPYEVQYFFSPYPLAVVFAPFALLPEPVAYSLYLLLNLVLLWKVVGLLRMLWPLFSFPVLFCLFVGQLDMLLALLVLTVGPWAWALLLIKPQVGFVVLPWFLLRTGWKGYLKALLGCVFLLGLSFLLRPSWLTEWLAGPQDSGGYFTHASNLTWLVPASLMNVRVIATVVGMVLVIPAGILLKKRLHSWVSLQLLAPLTNIYSVSVLAEWIGPIEVLLSWLAIYLVGGNIHQGAPMFVVGVSILIREILQVTRATPSSQEVRS